MTGTNWGFHVCFWHARFQIPETFLHVKRVPGILPPETRNQKATQSALTHPPLARFAEGLDVLLFVNLCIPWLPASPRQLWAGGPPPRASSTLLFRMKTVFKMARKKSQPKVTESATPAAASGPVTFERTPRLLPRQGTVAFGIRTTTTAARRRWISCSSSTAKSPQSLTKKVSRGTWSCTIG